MASQFKAQLTDAQISAIGKQRLATLKTAVSKLSLVSSLLQKKYDDQGGENFFGRVLQRLERAWLCENAAVLISKSGRACVLQGEIYAKWRALGGMQFGAPDTDEQTAPDGQGRFQHFNNGVASIYWTAQTGAQAVWGEIRKHWSQMGWEKSYLGYPTSDEADIDGGRVSSFEHGDIYWWPDTGCIDLKGVVLHYTGLYCNQEGEDNSFADNSVEPYLIFSTLDTKQTNTVRSRIYDDVDTGEANPDLLELYRGRAYGMLMQLTLMENDSGSPDVYKEDIEKAMKAAHVAGTIALVKIPVIGGALAAVLGPLLQKLIPDIAEAFNALFNTQDDFIQEAQILLLPKNWWCWLHVQPTARSSGLDIKNQ